MTYETNKDYIKLTKQWTEYKELKTMANAGRLRTEREILEIVGKDLKEKGANTFPANVEITTGMEEKWNNDKIDDLSTLYHNNELPELPFWPFTITWKPNTEMMTILKTTANDVFVRVFSDALTIKPKKPSFKIKAKNQ